MRKMSPEYIEETIKEQQRRTFQLIETEIKLYPMNKERLEKLRLDIIQSANYSLDNPGIRGSLQSDPTLGKTIKLLETAELIELRERIIAIEQALNETKAYGEPLRLELIRLKYWEQGLSDRAIMTRLNIGHDTFYRWRKEFVWLVAQRLGWDAGQKWDRKKQYKKANSM